MASSFLLRTGVVGTITAMACCYIPALAVLFGAVGFSAWLGWLDYVLLPAMAIFISMIIVALARRRRESLITAPDAGSEP